MRTIQKLRHRKGWIAAGVILSVVLILSVVFFWYVSDYYHAGEDALAILSEDTGIIVKDNLTILSPLDSTDTAVIFYPGAKVEAEAYLPLLDQIRQTGVMCILVHMPFHMAIFDSDAAENVMALFPDVQHWYMAGHSMGGAMASRFAADHSDKVEGLILLGAYIYGDYPLENTLTIYGTQDGLAAEDIDYTTNTVPIEGGNHAQFGDYGVQKGDLPATISPQEQQSQTVKAIDEFIKQKYENAA